MVKTSRTLSAAGEGSVPGQEAKIPHGSWPKNQITKQKHYCNKFNKDFKHGPYQKNTKILRGRGGGKALSFSLHCQVQPSVNRLLIGLSYGTQFPRDNSGGAEQQHRLPPI